MPMWLHETLLVESYDCLYVLHAAGSKLGSSSVSRFNTLKRVFGQLNGSKHIFLCMLSYWIDQS